MAVWICDRCGDIGTDPDVCRCRTSFDPVAVRRRLRQAVARARQTDEFAEADQRRRRRAA